LTWWGLSDGLLVDVHLRLQDELPSFPTAFLQKDLSWFGGKGMVYGFDLIDPDNRLLVHAFRFQVFYHADEQTLLVTRGAHVTGEGVVTAHHRSGLRLIAVVSALLRMRKSPSSTIHGVGLKVTGRSRPRRRSTAGRQCRRRALVR
jgi:hypothetical protein